MDDGSALVVPPQMILSAIDLLDKTIHRMEAAGMSRQSVTDLLAAQVLARSHQPLEMYAAR